MALGQVGGVSRASSWSGYMQTAMSAAGAYTLNVTGVKKLPVIDLDPTNPTAINSPLLYAARDCRRRVQERRQTSMSISVRLARKATSPTG